MESFRQSKNSVAVKAILSLIVFSFLFTGFGSYWNSNSVSFAARVDRTKITLNDLERVYQGERDRITSQLGDTFESLFLDPKYATSFRRSILDRMINDLLLEKYSKSLGLAVNDSEIHRTIFNMEEFQDNGKFDKKVYRDTLRRSGLSSKSFEQHLRRSYLLYEQLIPALQSSNFILKGEMEAYHQLITQVRNIRRITIPIENFSSKISLDDQKIAEYYKENPDIFTQPEQMKFSYVELSLESLKKQIVIKKNEAMEYYQKNLDKYTSEEQRKVSQIFVRGDNREKAQKILDKLNTGTDFFLLAKESSESVVDTELGWIERNVMDYEFEKAAFSLKELGEVSGLVKSNFGYHIIRLDDMKGSSIQPYQQVVNQIREDLTVQQANEEFYKLRSELEKSAFESPYSLNDAAQAINQKVYSTGFISQKEYPEILKKPGVFQAIATKEVKEDGLNSEIIEISPDHLIVIRVEDFHDPILLSLETVSDAVATRLIQIRSEEEAVKFSKELIISLELDDKKILERNNLKFSPIEQIDRNSSLADVVFSMKKPVDGRPVYYQDKDLNGDIIIVALYNTESKANPDYDHEIAAQLTKFNSDQEISSVLNVLRSSADIEYYI
ncbi:peptidyl-prolyl cis-trans isomerase D [Candidatus Photodesmus blepharus]|uniref:Periplasmic chaperone PpiD n=1 Tax=Candidatus Photodesmus blepharonis TaxID=1179155 RepID=A0A084CMA7_9GAMM|nr:SurA N-terminal domain-containing protein [Candidatus Photodesmus blepharus]KEY90936.1 peptidyl-prolyl cis-trans isomerase D [Candidatus Photodesmus blepharus]